MNALQKAVNQIIDSIINEDPPQCSNELDDRIREEVDDACTYTQDCREIAVVADTSTLDSSLWKGETDLDRIFTAIAYTAIKEGVYAGMPDLDDLLQDDDDKEEES